MRNLTKTSFRLKDDIYSKDLKDIIFVKGINKHFVKSFIADSEPNVLSISDGWLNAPPPLWHKKNAGPERVKVT